MAEMAGAAAGEPDEMVVTLPDGCLYSFPKDVLRKHKLSQEKVQELLQSTPPPVPTPAGGAAYAGAAGREPTVHIVGPVPVPDGAAVGPGTSLTGAGQPPGRPVGQPVVHLIEGELPQSAAAAAAGPVPGRGLPIVQVIGPVTVPEGTPLAGLGMPAAAASSGGTAQTRTFGPTVISGP